MEFAFQQVIPSRSNPFLIQILIKCEGKEAWTGKKQDYALLKKSTHVPIHTELKP
jgi:hypothetical protein